MAVYPTRLPFNCRVCHCLFKKQKYGKWRYIKGGEWGGSTKSNSVCFTKKIGSKLEPLMRLLRVKFGTLCHWTKKIKDAVVYEWGRQL